MNFVGDARGDYVQELSYKWVGEGQGEFDVVEGADKRRSYSGCLCLLGSLFVFALIVGMNMLVEQPSTMYGLKHHGGRVGHAEDEHYECNPRALQVGELVQAAFDISFRPAGFVPEGSVGTVAALLPGGDNRVVVDWRGLAQLQGSKVSRSQLVKALRPGDAVEAVADVMVETAALPRGHLAVDDLVITARPLQGVQQGTFGYVASVAADGAGRARFVLDFPEFPQFASTEASQADVQKAPRVGDRVEAVRGLAGEGGPAVAPGAVGTVAAMLRQGAAYVYKVNWQDLPQAADKIVKGLDLQVAAESANPAPARIPRGASGEVRAVVADRGLSDANLAVAWRHPALGHVNVSRGQVVKVPDWSQAQREYCCRTAQVECPLRMAHRVGGEPFSCDVSLQAWGADEAVWCCKNRGIGCSQSPGAPARPAALFNCSTHEDWPARKSSWCCLHEQKGCDAQL